MGKTRGSKTTRVVGDEETASNILTDVKPESEGQNERERSRKTRWIEAMKAQTVKTPRAVARVDGTVRIKGRSGGLVDFLPPLPDEADLFVPPLANKKFEQWCTEALQLLDTLEEGQSLTLKWMALISCNGSEERGLTGSWCFSTRRHRRRTCFSNFAPAARARWLLVRRRRSLRS